MNIFRRIAAAAGFPYKPHGRDPRDDWWYEAVGAAHGVSATTALSLTVVLACVKAIAEAIGSLPLNTFERRPNGDKVPRPNHPLYDVLHTLANEEQTAAEYREMVIAFALLRGTAFSEIVPGRRGAVDQVVPIHPDHAHPVKVVDSQGRAQWQLEVRKPGEPHRRLLRDELFIVRGISLGPDVIVGLDPIATEAQALGSALAANDYAGRFFANDARPSGLLKHPGTFKSDEDRDRFRRAWERFTGSGRHRTAVLEHGIEYQGVSVTPEQAQFLETRQYQDVDICRIFRVQPHKVGILDRATFSNIEQQALEFVSDTLGPWLVRFEQAISRDLILAPQRFFAEHNVAGLLRGDLKSRYEAYAIGRNWGWLSVNDILRLENRNSIGPDGDVYLQPLNMAPAGDPAEPSRQQRAPGSPPRREPPDARHMLQARSGLWLPQ